MCIRHLPTILKTNIANCAILDREASLSAAPCPVANVRAQTCSIRCECCASDQTWALRRHSHHTLLAGRDMKLCTLSSRPLKGSSSRHRICLRLCRPSGTRKVRRAHLKTNRPVCSSPRRKIVHPFCPLAVIAACKRRLCFKIGVKYTMPRDFRKATVPKYMTASKADC